MTRRHRRRGVPAAAAVVVLAGCANLPFSADRSAAGGPPAAMSTASAGTAGSDAATLPATAATPSTAAAAAPPAPAPAASAAAAGDTATALTAQYRLEVDAPPPLRSLLLDYLDLARFRSVPVGEVVNATELERLLRAAPAQARQLLETEGYFDAKVVATRDGSAAGLPLLRIAVETGALTIVGSVAVTASGELGRAAASGQPAATAELAALRAQWPLAPGAPFRQAAWSSAKVATLARARADGWAAATWARTDARIDAVTSRADLAVELESGPRFRLGPLRISGLERYDASTVRRLATFSPGDPYREQTLLNFQERLQKLGLFESASVELDDAPATAAAAPVLVRVREQPAQQATFGIGVSADTGARFSLEHVARNVLGTHWIARNKLEFGPTQRKWSGELTSYPLADLYRNLVSASFADLRVRDEQLDSWNVRAGRSQDTTRISRLYYAEIAHARLDSATLTNTAEAVSIDANWVFRDVDNLLLPTRGVVSTWQVGLGVAHGTRSVQSEPIETARGPFARLYARLNGYRPFADGWLGSARLEAGQVLTRSAVGVPDTLLFRAGGDDSVRGYAYRELGPSIAGVTISGRVLLTGSVEAAHSFLARLPALLGAVFVDAGNAADRWSTWKPAFGYGVGLRYESPVGPLRADLAYGQDDRRLRFHFSVGAAF